LVFAHRFHGLGKTKLQNFFEKIPNLFDDKSSQARCLFKKLLAAMKTYSFRLLLTLLLAFVFSCQEEENPSPNPNPPVASKPLEKTVDVNVVLPPGVSMDLSKAKVTTGLMDFDVDASGKSKAVLPDGVFRMAYAMDDKNRILLMGILHEKNKTLDIASTAEALFYLGAGVYFQPEPVIREYLSSATALVGMEQFKKQLENQIRADIEYIEKGKFEKPLEDYLAEFRKEDEPLDIKARKITVDPTGFQSGIQLFENDGLSIKLANHYRRRAQAFIYKTGFKPKGSKEEVVLLSSISANEKAAITKEIEPTSAFSSVLGTIVDQLMGKGIEYARKETDPISLPLGDSEDGATYQVRVVGTAFYPTTSPQMTQEELTAWQKIMIKQFYLDFIAPILSEIFSEIKGSKDTNFGFEAFEYFLSQSPAIWQLIEKGDWKNATQETIKYLLVDKAGQELQKKFIEILVDKYRNLPNPSWIDLDREYNNANAAGKYVKLIKAVELTVKLLDMGKLTAEIAMSDRIDVYTATIHRNDVRIGPEQSTVVPFASQTLTAETQTQLSQGQTFVYKWSTTSNFGGTLISGGQRGVAIETTTKTVTFRSQANSADLGEDNIETVTVEVYIKSGNELSLVGDGKAKVNVKKLKTIMRPDNITLSGGQSVRLYLERSDMVNDIVSNDVLEYKVDWVTTGKYGKFDGIHNTATTRGNAITLTILDKDVKEAKEFVTARIFFKARTDPNWTLREVVTGEIKVVNDALKIILDLPFVTTPWDNSDGISCNVGVLWGPVIPVHPKAVRYTVTFYGFKKAHGWDNQSDTWLAGRKPPKAPFTLHEANNELIYNGNIYYGVSASWASGPMSSACGEAIVKAVDFYQAYGGRANIVIEITD
jgi:hypothetical protein